MFQSGARVCVYFSGVNRLKLPGLSGIRPRVTISAGMFLYSLPAKYLPRRYSYTGKENTRGEKWITRGPHCHFRPSAFRDIRNCGREL